MSGKLLLVMRVFAHDKQFFARLIPGKRVNSRSQCEPAMCNGSSRIGITTLKPVI